MLTSTFIGMRDRLRRVAASIVGEDAAEDVVHDAFCKLWAANSLVADEIQASKLSYRVVRNAAIDELRRSTRSRESRLDEIPEQSEATESDDVYGAVLALARRHLTEKQFAIMQMHDIEGVGYEEIAAELAMTQENVRVTLSRARKTVRELYRKQQR